jgi:hypothetical protein
LCTAAATAACSCLCIARLVCLSVLTSTMLCLLMPHAVASAGARSAGEVTRWCGIPWARHMPAGQNRTEQNRQHSARLTYEHTQTNTNQQQGDFDQWRKQHVLVLLPACVLLRMLWREMPRRKVTL